LKSKTIIFRAIAIKAVAITSLTGRISLRVYFATAKEFRHQINHFFDRTLPSIADSLNERINDNFQVLSSAS
jgi:hypothetical protein